LARRRSRASGGVKAPPFSLFPYPASCFVSFPFDAFFLGRHALAYSLARPLLYTRAAARPLVSSCLSRPRAETSFCAVATPADACLAAQVHSHIFCTLRPPPPAVPALSPLLPFVLRRLRRPPTASLAFCRAGQPLDPNKVSASSVRCYSSHRALTRCVLLHLLRPASYAGRPSGRG
jgi:hypothetical protein